MNNPIKQLGKAISRLGDRGSASAWIVVSLMGGALLGKLLGFAREILMARILGASVVADSFRASITAVQLPLLPMLGESTPAVLIPMHRAWQDEHRAPLMLSALSIVLGLTAGLLMLLVQLTGQWWVRVLVGGFSPEGQRIALELIQVMALWMPAAVVVECLAAGEIAVGKSRIGALRSAVLNAFVIMGLLFYALSNNLMGLAWQFALSFNALAAWGCWLLAREGALSIKGLRISVLLAAGREFVRRLRPFIFLPVFQQGNTWVERLVASGFVVGTLSSLEYARTLTDTVVLLISQPIGMAVLYGGSTTANRSISAVVPALLSITLPACVYLAVFAPDVVRLVFDRGAFDETAVALTSGAMRGMAIGMWAGAVGTVLLRHLNNDGRNRIAAAILAISFTTGMMVNLTSSYWAGTGEVRNAFLLGSADSARCVVLLIAVTLALGCYWSVMRLIALAALPAAAMGGLCWLVTIFCSAPLMRVTMGGAVCIGIMLLTALLLMPAQVMALRTRFAHAP